MPVHCIVIRHACGGAGNGWDFLAGWYALESKVQCQSESCGFISNGQQSSVSMNAIKAGRIFSDLYSHDTRWLQHQLAHTQKKIITDGTTKPELAYHTLLITLSMGAVNILLCKWPHTEGYTYVRESIHSGASGSRQITNDTTRHLKVPLSNMQIKHFFN